MAETKRRKNPLAGPLRTAVVMAAAGGAFGFLLAKGGMAFLPAPA